MAHCTECGTALVGAALHCPPCTGVRLGAADGDSPDSLTTAAFCAIEPELLIATVLLPAARTTPSEASGEYRARWGAGWAVYVLGCLVVVITAAFIARALVTSG